MEHPFRVIPWRRAGDKGNEISRIAAIGPEQRFRKLGFPNCPVTYLYERLADLYSIKF